MDINEQRAHDLALLFLEHKLEQNPEQDYDEESIFDKYKSAYDNFYDLIMNP